MRTGVQGAGCDEDTDEGKCGWGVWTEVNSVSQKQAVLKKKIREILFKVLPSLPHDTRLFH